MTALTRRSAFSLAGAGAVALGLAACSPTGGDADTGSAGAVTPSKAANGKETMALSQVPVGGSISTTVGGQPVLVSQITNGQVKAYSAICTHQGCVVAAAGTEFDCPCHGSKFDAATGKVLHGPAKLPLDTVDVTVSGDTITFG